MQLSGTTLKRGLFICLMGGLFYCMDYAIQTSPSVIMSDLMQHFDCDALGLAVISSFFFYGNSLMQLPAGILIDRYGLHITIGIAMLVCALGIYIFSCTNSFVIATTARFIIGAGFAFSFIGTIALIHKYLPNNVFATSVGVLQLLGAFGSLMGQAPLEIVKQLVGWQHSLALFGAILLILSMVFFMMTKNLGTNTKMVHTTTHHSKNKKTLYRNALKSRRLWILAGCAMFSWAPVGTLGAIWGVPFFQAGFHLTSVEASELMMFFWAGVATTPFIGRIADITQKETTIILAGFILVTINTFILLHSHSIVLSAIALYCIGLSCANAVLVFPLAKKWFHESIFATLCGVLNMATIIGAGLAQFLSGLILHHLEPHTNTAHAAFPFESLRGSLSILPMAAILGLFTCLALHIINSKTNTCKVETI